MNISCVKDDRMDCLIERKESPILWIKLELEKERWVFMLGFEKEGWVFMGEYAPGN